MAAAALHRGPALLLRLRRHLLTAESTRLLSSRAEPKIQQSSSFAAANASPPPAAPPSPRPIRSPAPSMYTHCPPSRPSSPSISRHHPPSPRPTLSVPSILPQCGQAVDCRRRISSLYQHQHLWVQRRNISSLEPKRAPPVACLVDVEEPDLWLDPVDFFKKYHVLQDSRSNPLNLEILGFGEKPDLHFSEIGCSVFHCLIHLILVNSNRGYCVKGSFTRDNILMCPRLGQVRLKSVLWTLLDADSKDFNRAASYAAIAIFMEGMLEEVYGPDIMSHLSIEPVDLFSKLLLPSDERLIVFHPSLLSVHGRAWMYHKVYQLLFQILPSKSVPVLEKRTVRTLLASMAYTDMKPTVEEIIKTHPLLRHIESSQHARGRNKELAANNISPSPSTMGKKEDHMTELINLGKKVAAIPRHTIEHALDKESKEVLSSGSTEELPKTIWPYSLEQVVDMLRTVFPLHMLKTQEAFLANDLWSELNMSIFWAQELDWMGSVPMPTEKEKNAIRSVRYGKRRLNARKFGRPQRR